MGAPLDHSPQPRRAELAAARSKVTDPSAVGASRDLRIATLGNVDAGKSTLVGCLTKGVKDDGRGADIVVRDMRDLVPVVDHFKSAVESGEKAPVKFPRALLDGLVDKYWVDEARVVA